MISFLLLTLPLFGIIACGWVAQRARMATPRDFDALAAFSFRFALPALVFRLIANQPLARSFNPDFLAGYLLAGGLVFAMTFFVSRLLQGQGVAVAAAHATTGTVSNLGFLGPPVMLALFGEHGAGPLALAIVVEVMVLLSIGTAIMAAARGNARHAGALVLLTTVLNPLLVAILLGAALSSTHLSLPEPADRFLGFLGASAGPTALFALGGALAMRRIDRGTLWAAGSMSALKLLIYPLVAWCVLRALLRLDPFWVHAGVILAALPSAGSNYVLAQRYEADASRVSAAVALSTFISVMTTPLSAWLMLSS